MDDLDLEGADILIPDFHSPESSHSDERRSEPRSDRREMVVAAPDTAPNAVLCLAFQGVSGGAGATSLAIATAHQLARRAPGRVCIVDLDFELGAVAHYLDIGTGPKIDDLCVDPSRVDATFVRATVSHHASGLAVFGSPAVASGNARANSTTVLAILDRLSELYPILVLDLPRGQLPWTEAATRAADRVVLVSELHIPALHLARQTLSRLDNSGVAATDIVINKHERRSFKASIRVKDAERALGREVSAVVALDLQAPVEAINCGEPGGRLDTEGSYARDLGALARTLAPAFAERRDGKAGRRGKSAKAGQKRGQKKGLFRRKVSAA